MGSAAKMPSQGTAKEVELREVGSERGVLQKSQCKRHGGTWCADRGCGYRHKCGNGHKVGRMVDVVETQT